MIPARRIKSLSKLFALYMRYRMRKAFNLLVVPPFEIKEGHSILLLSNHFSWWDAFYCNYLANWYFFKDSYAMMQEEHLKKRMLLNLFGGFSINRSSREMIKSLQYAAGLLDNPENVVVVFPQGRLISNHTTAIEVEKGIERLIKNIKSPCQIVYLCTFIDYFESLKPSAYMHLLDCGIAGELSFDELTEKINTFHRQALKDQVNVEH